MERFLQAAALAMVAAVLAVVLQKQSKEISVLLVMACSAVILALADMVTILLKTAGVGLLAELAAAVCEDAGEGTLGKVARLCGSAAALYLALPLLTAVLDMLREMLKR